MKCPYELEEVFEVVFSLSGSEIDILMQLCDNPGTPKEVAEGAGKDRSTVQRYLSSLMKAGLVSRERVDSKGRGRSYRYIVDRDALKVKVRSSLDEWYEDRVELIGEL